MGAGHIPVVDLGSLRVVDLDSKNGLRDADSRVSKLNPGWRWEGEGVVFCTYSLLSRSINQKDRESVLRVAEQVVPVMRTHNAVNNEIIDVDASIEEIQPSDECASMKVTTRLGQILKWMSQSPLKASSGLSPRLSRHLQRHPNESWKSVYWNFVPEKILPGGLLCFDEAHKAKNLVSELDPSKSVYRGTSTGQTVKMLQDLLKHCPVRSFSDI